MKKLLALILASILVFSLCSCSVSKLLEEAEKYAEEMEEETQEQETTEEEITDTTEKKEEEPKKGEYDPSGWVKDNFTISYYYSYQGDGEPEEITTLKRFGDKALMSIEKKDEDPRPSTLYAETDEGIVVTSLFYVADSKGGVQSLPHEEKELEEALPTVLVIAGTFGARADDDVLEKMNKKGTETYIGRKCDKYIADSGSSQRTVLIDKETGIILKNITEYIMNGEKTVITHVMVTELEYGNVKEEEVNIDLSQYNITVEEAETAES